MLAIVTLGIGYIIWLLFAWRDGQTPGKKVTNLKYVDINTGRVADWGKSAFRDFVIRGIVIGIISAFTLYIGFLVAAFMIFDQDKNYRAGWDRWPALWSSTSATSSSEARHSRVNTKRGTASVGRAPLRRCEMSVSPPRPRRP